MNVSVNSIYFSVCWSRFHALTIQPIIVKLHLYMSIKKILIPKDIESIKTRVKTLLNSGNFLKTLI